MTDGVRSFPFTPGFACTVDPEAAARQLAEVCKAAGAVMVPRRDLEVLLLLARRGAGELPLLPDGMMMSEAVRVLERYAAR